MGLPLIDSLRNQLQRIFTRGFKNHISSPTHSPGFILFDNFDELTVKSSINDALPASLSTLIKPSKSQFVGKLSSLRGPMSQIDISINKYLRGFKLILSLGSAVRVHPNQEPISVPHLLKLKPLHQFNLDEAVAWDLEGALFDTIEDSVANEEVQCANVLKKRRRKMRGHKHKKRLKERRHKSDK